MSRSEIFGGTAGRTESRLLPTGFAGSDNAREIRHYKLALRDAIDTRLTPVQREHVRLHYWEGMRKSDIARRCGTSCSAVHKSLCAAQAAIKSHVELYMHVYKLVEQDLLREEEQLWGS